MSRSKKNRSTGSPAEQQDGARLPGQADSGTDTDAQPVTDTAQDQGALPGKHGIFSIPEAIEITDKMRSQLQARGAKTIRGLGRCFRHFDSQDGNRKCDANEFFTGLQDIGVHVSKAECDVSFASQYQEFSLIAG